jgi:hypothetical protein
MIVWWLEVFQINCQRSKLLIHDIFLLNLSCFSNKATCWLIFMHFFDRLDVCYRIQYCLLIVGKVCMYTWEYKILKQINEINATSRYDMYFNRLVNLFFGVSYFIEQICHNHPVFHLRHRLPDPWFCFRFRVVLNRNYEYLISVLHVSSMFQVSLKD